MKLILMVVSCSYISFVLTVPTFQRIENALYSGDYATAGQTLRHWNKLCRKSEDEKRELFTRLKKTNEILLEQRSQDIELLNNGNDTFLCLLGAFFMTETATRSLEKHFAGISCQQQMIGFLQGAFLSSLGYMCYTQQNVVSNGKRFNSLVDDLLIKKERCGADYEKIS